ncbi:MAG: translation initiation factor IF-2 [Candidatus Marinimicrobia bacterium]|nr:translation initiation factor IF-2 [Candidatus Neomarinimicrobiota bacterium]
MEQASKKKRIFQIAKDLNISHTEIIDFLEREGVAVASHMSPVEPEVLERILGEFAKEMVIEDRKRKELARRGAELLRREDTGTKARFDRILSLEEQQKLEAQEAEVAKKALEEAAHIAQQELAETAGKAAPKSEPAEMAVTSPKAEELESGPADAGTAPDGAEAGIKDALKGDSKIPTVETAKPKLKRIVISEIESKIAQGRQRLPGRKDKKEPAARSKSVEQTLRQTLASMSAREKKRRPPRRERIEKDADAASAEGRTTIRIHEFMSVSELASAMDVSPMEVISSCLELGIMATINQRLDLETLTLLADVFEFAIQEEDVLNDDTILQEIASKTDSDGAVARPPVVTVMGHVDHGKTSLLDHIRSSEVAQGESGGITQHIGAYSVVLPDGQQITFLDTPGHEAFTAMRARGAQVTDIVILVVAADDAVMPQTIEAINHARAAGVHLVVAINKIDKPDADVERVKRELADQKVLVEDWGGKIQSAEVSAKMGTGIEDLLDKILLEAEILDLQANRDSAGVGTIIESKLDRGLGPVATVLVQSGTLRQGETFLCGSQIGRVRAMQDEHGVRVKQALPSDPVQVQGFERVPQAGDRFIVFEDEREAKRISMERSRLRREIEYRRKSIRTLDEISSQIATGAIRQLSILLKADVDGSLEALADSLQDLSTGEVAVDIIHRGVGMVSENDVLLATASGAVIIAFGVGTSPGAKVLAKKDKVDIRGYDIIYNAVSEIKLALEGLLEPEQVEETLGLAEVRAVFRVSGVGIVAGCYLKEGKAVRNALVRVKRDGELVHEGEIISLKRFKDDVKEVQEGFECGIGVEGFSDFEEGDTLELYEVKEVKRTLA